MMKLGFFIATALAVLAGCQNTPTRVPTQTKGAIDTRSMKELLSTHIPRGTAVVEAKRFMEGEGFECQVERNSSFIEEGVSHRGIDYLYCDRSDSTKSRWVSRRWQIALVIKDEVISDILVSVGLIGP
jgi:hypothetical protein